MNRKALTVVLVLITLIPFTNAFAQEWKNPVIKGFGAEHYLPNVAGQPDKNMNYKIIFYIEKNSDNSQANNGLVHLARLINVFDAAGIPPKRLKLVAIITGEATFSTLNDVVYEKKFGSDNPNDFLLKQLKKKGHVKIFVCGQALTGLGFSQKDLNPNVTEALSALTVLPTYELKGYALMPFN